MRRARPTVRLVRAEDSSSQNGKKTKGLNLDSAQQILAVLVREGVPEVEAWDRVGSLLRGAEGFTPKSDVVTISEDDYLSSPGKDKMAVATKPKRPGPKLRRRSPNNVPLTDHTLEHIQARAIARYREERQLSVPKIAAEMEIDQNAWYRMESGNNPATVALYINAIAEAAGQHVLDFLERGRKP